MPGGCGKLAISRRIITLSTNEHSAACAEDSTDPIAERTMDQDPAQPEIDMCPVTLPNFYRTGRPDAERTPREAKSASESDHDWITLPYLSPQPNRAFFLKNAIRRECKSSFYLFFEFSSFF